MAHTRLGNLEKYPLSPGKTHPSERSGYSPKLQKPKFWKRYLGPPKGKILATPLIMTGYISIITLPSALFIAITDISHIFLKNDFHYLNVANTGTFGVTDVFDCTFQCLRLPSCVSVNFASNRGADGKFWCELLSSDKYVNSLEFKGNQTSHHLFKKVNCWEFE